MKELPLKTVGSMNLFTWTVGGAQCRTWLAGSTALDRHPDALKLLGVRLAHIEMMETQKAKRNRTPLRDAGNDDCCIGNKRLQSPQIKKDVGALCGYLQSRVGGGRERGKNQ